MGIPHLHSIFSRRSHGDSTQNDLAAPSLPLLALEFRAFAEFGAVLPSWPALQKAKRGDGHEVIVYPGLTANDLSTLPLRKYLSSLGYAVQGWGQGSNFGPKEGVMDQALAQLQKAHSRSGKKVSLVGWSLGGVFARELAKLSPNRVRSVITLGTPFAAGLKSNNAWRLYEWVSGRKIDREEAQFDLATAPSVPTTSIYSRSDGVVAWQGSVQAQSENNRQIENIEVIASHFGLGLNPSAWWTVADRLALKDGQWEKFKAPKLLGLGAFIFPVQRN